MKQANLGQISAIMLIVLGAVLSAALSAQEPATGQSGKTFAWQRTSTFFYDAPRFEGEPVQEQLEAAMVGAMQARGYRLVDSVKQADLELSYVAVLQNASSTSDIASFREAHPSIAGLEDGPSKFEGGVLYTKLVDHGSKTKIWENRYQGLVALDMPQAQRAIRTNEIIEEVFSTFSR